MAIAQPVTRTIISTTDFGIPVTQFINYWTPTPWVNIPLVNGFISEASFLPAQYRRTGDWLEMRSSITGLQPSGTLMATMPTGFRPVGTQRVNATCYSSSLPGSAIIRMDFTTAGMISWYDLPAGALFIVLTGVRIPLS